MLFVFSVMSDVRGQVSWRCRRQPIPPFLRWLLCPLYILQVWVLYDAQAVFSVMSDVRTQLFRKWRRQLMPPVLRWLLCLPYPASLSLVGRITSIFLFWLTGELYFGESAGDKSYLLFHDDFNALSTFFKFLRGRTQKQFSWLEVTR